MRKSVGKQVLIMKKIDILFLILLCIDSLNAISFVLADLSKKAKDNSIKI